jgi:predicted RNA polymerase sigma factor
LPASSGDPGRRAPLILQPILGFDATSIASAFLLARLGKTLKAAAAYDRAIGLECDPAVGRFLQDNGRGFGRVEKPGPRPSVQAGHMAWEAFSFLIT